MRRSARPARTERVPHCTTMVRTRPVPDAACPAGSAETADAPRPGSLGPDAVRRVAGYVVAVVGTVGADAALLPFRDDITPLSKGFGSWSWSCSPRASAASGPGSSRPSSGSSPSTSSSFRPTALSPSGGPSTSWSSSCSWRCPSSSRRCWHGRTIAPRRRRHARPSSGPCRHLEFRPGGRASRAARPTHVLDRLDPPVRVPGGALHFQEPTSSELREPVTVGAATETIIPDWDPASTGRPPERLPLTVGRPRPRAARASRETGPPLDPAESRVLRAFCDQFALILERRPAPAGGDTGRGVPADGGGPPIAPGRRVSRPAKPAGGDQGLGDGPARGGSATTVAGSTTREALLERSTRRPTG